MRPDNFETTVHALRKQNPLPFARAALRKLMDPLVGFALDAGISVHEFQRILRESAVRTVARRQHDSSGRINASGISATTGLPRSLIANCLSAKDKAAKFSSKSVQVTQRVLGAWHLDPKFTDANGNPAVLDVLGPGQTFESLARAYARGVSCRALLDELMQIGAVELLSTKKIRARSAIAIHRGFDVESIRTFGENAFQLISIMLDNIRDSKQNKFVASVEKTGISLSFLPMIRREVESRGSNFLSDLEESLFKLTDVPQRGTLKSKRQLLNAKVTVFFYEDSGSKKKNATISRTRQNFKRKK